MTLRKRSTLVLALFAVVFTTLCVASYTRESATYDEPLHLATGDLGWQGDHRMDPEHPPFLRLWAALPLTIMGDIKSDLAPIDQISPADWIGIGQFQYAHAFAYLWNDADRMLYRARFMVVLLGVLLGGLLFCWAHEWLGFWPAVGALALYTLEPNILAHSSLVTTDMAVTCFTFGTLYFLWRTTRTLTVGNLAGLAIFFLFAIISKFSALILGPIVFLLLAIHLSRDGSWTKVVSRLARTGIAGGIVVGLALIAWVGIWAVYGFRFNPSVSPDWIYRFQDDPSVFARTPALAHLIAWSDRHHLLPNAFSQGLLFGQAKAQARGAFLAGTISGTGWWYYFPFAFAIKTPVAVLVLLVGALGLVARSWRTFLDTAVFIVLPIAIYLGTAMLQKLNIGARHILPLYPFAILLGTVAIAWLLQRNRKVLVGCVAALVIMEAFEFGRAYPHPLAFFNAFVGGPANGHKYLVDSNLDWGQDLKPLKRWMVDNNVDQINLAYFGTADPAYYGIRQTPLPGAPFFNTDSIAEPKLPGYVAVSATILSGAYGSDAERQLYQPLRNLVPVAIIGYSINVYRIEQPWWK
jgi:hypothetical protein